MAKERRKPAVFSTGKVNLIKDPRVYAERLPATPSGQKRCLGLDIATNCGVAFCDFVPGQPVKDRAIVMGQWDLSVGDYDTGPLRHIRLKQFLAIAKPDLIVFEEVRHVGSNASFGGASTMTAIVARVASGAALIGGLTTTMATWAEENNVPVQGVGVGQIKKVATGKGNANKVEMIEAANQFFGTNFVTTDYESTGVDNMVDAAYCCFMGLTAYSEGLS